MAVAMGTGDGEAVILFNLHISKQVSDQAEESFLFILLLTSLLAPSTNTKDGCQWHHGSAAGVARMASTALVA